MYFPKVENPNMSNNIPQMRSACFQKPFYYGASQVPVNLGLPKQSYSGVSGSGFYGEGVGKSKKIQRVGTENDRQDNFLSIYGPSSSKKIKPIVPPSDAYRESRKQARRENNYIPRGRGFTGDAPQRRMPIRDDDGKLIYRTLDRKYYI